MQGAVLEQHLVYWRQQLQGVPAQLGLPTDHPRPAVQAFRGAQVDFMLSASLAQQLQTLSQQKGVTLFMTLLAVFKILLMRYSAQEDIVVGTLIANNILVLRTDLSGQPTFREALHLVRAVTLGAYAHQDLPFEQLVEELIPERGMSYSPLFQVLFVLQGAPRNDLTLPEVSIYPIEVKNASVKPDLALAWVETAEGLAGRLEYNATLFEEARIVRVVGHLQLLLEEIVANPEQRIWNLALLAPEERTQILVGWNQAMVSPRELSLSQLFEEQVEHTPDAIALVFEDQWLTYDELNRRANQLARYLRRQGVGPEVLVGLCLQRSLELIVALLAILKAGGAYLPLDPGYPPERIAFMLEDADALLVLTQQEPVEQILPWVSLNSLLSTLSQEDETNTESLGQIENLAYVIYTSGSTGRPKGVEITHRSVLALLAWACQQFGPEERKGVLASTSICFDLSIFELFVPLSTGGMVLLARDVLHLPTLPAANGVTLLNTVPSALAALLRMSALPPSVRSVALAGETLAASLVEQVFEQEGVEQVYNLYGPTEDTTYSTWAQLPAGSADPIPIGRPIGNTQAYVLDRYGQPVPAGVVGELYLGGAGLARGYVHKAALTAERFVPDPFSGQAGARLYRTGDLTRYRVDGNGSLEFLGRKDQQVKVRGFRIELGEIEGVLSQHPKVREALVVAQETIPDNKRLVAYIIGQPGEVSQGDELRCYLQEKLPHYMVPSVFVQMEVWPLTPNGKIDRRALPEGNQLEQEENYTAPQNAIEELLTEIWEQVLKVKRIGSHDNFFTLGGHSLLATQILARIQAVFELDLPFHSIFEASTIAGLAQIILHKLAEQVDNTMLATLEHASNDEE